MNQHPIQITVLGGKKSNFFLKQRKYYIFNTALLLFEGWKHEPCQVT